MFLACMASHSAAKGSFFLLSRKDSWDHMKYGRSSCRWLVQMKREGLGRCCVNSNFT